MDRALKNKIGNDLMTQLRNDNNIEQNLKQKEVDDMQHRIQEH
jgi:hypothetical protein